MTHSSGSWNLLQRKIVDKFEKLSKFEGVEAHELCFEFTVDGQTEIIEDEFTFNILVDETKVVNNARILPELKVNIKGKIFISTWYAKWYNIL